MMLTDNEIGFKEVYAERIFQLLHPVDGKSEYSGTGLTLTICRKIEVDHQRLIFTTGEVGKGAIFSIILPQEE